MSKRLNSAVPSSSFLLVCNYCVIAQSGFVGVDVYTQAIVQDLGGGGGEQKKKKKTRKFALQMLQDRSGPELQSPNSSYPLTFAGWFVPCLSLNLSNSLLIS